MSGDAGITNKDVSNSGSINSLPTRITYIHHVSNSINQNITHPPITNTSVSNSILLGLAGILKELGGNSRSPLEEISFILRSELTFKLLMCLQEVRAATWPVLRTRTSLNEAALSRGLERLIIKGVVEVYDGFPHIKMRGPRPRIYALKGCGEEDLRRAVEEHLLVKTPAFNEAMRIYGELESWLNRWRQGRRLSWRQDILPRISWRKGYDAKTVLDLLRWILDCRGWGVDD
ncbi:MAG: hypothetical protein QXD04_06610 [Candidatus Bathyarchaeia archaeon]